MKALFLVLIVIFMLACGVSSEQLTATAVIERAQTQTAAPTSTFTPTFTPRPTSTLKPTQTLEPTLAAVGETVQYQNLEITLLEVVTHTQIMLSSGFGYDANEGVIFIDVTVLGRNRGGSTVAMTTDEIYIAEETGEAWYPSFGGFQTVGLEKRFNPMATIKLDNLSGNEVILFENDTYLRLVFPVHEHQDILFGLQNSPQFAFPVE